VSTLDVFSEVFELPDPYKQSQFNDLVGLDDIKERLLKEGQLLLNPSLIDEWSKKHHGKTLPIVNQFHQRSPLIIFSGDVGTGKTSLAESFGDPIARKHKITVKVFRLSLNSRGSGAVGEMTRLISSAFAEVEKVAKEGKPTSGRSGSSVILIIDEADALVQSREFDQMHHEDRAGVNSVIRGIDQLTNKHLPVLIVMCTNRMEAIDPAVMRRASSHFDFLRPNKDQRHAIFNRAYEDVLQEDEIGKLVDLTGRQNGRKYGYTYSDLTQKIISTSVIDAFPDRKLSFDIVDSIIKQNPPTKPFGYDK